MTRSKGRKWLDVVAPTLLFGGGLGVLGFLRSHFQYSKMFLPDRFPNGIWTPQSFGLPARDVWFRSADGEELHAWWIPYASPRGTILFLHGNTGSIANRIGILRVLRRLRVNLMAPDYRGYGRSSGKPSEKGLYLDARAAFDHLTQVIGESQSRVILFGHSLGGAVAIDCALDRQPAGFVVQSSFTHVRDAARALFPTLPLHLVATRQFASIDKVPGIRLPKLFIHGTEDETVPLELGQRLFAAAAEPKELYLVQRAGHNDIHLHGGLKYLRRLARFRDRCLETG